VDHRALDHRALDHRASDHRASDHRASDHRASDHRASGLQSDDGPKGRAKQERLFEPRWQSMVVALISIPVSW